MIPLGEEAARTASDQLELACQTMEKLLNGLQDSDGRIAEEVHAIRKLAKSLRGGFSLFGLGKSSAREIRAIGRLLSEPRDAVSRFGTWEKLAWQDDPAAAAAIGGLLDQQTRSAARRPPPEVVQWCLARVAAARANLRDLPPEELPARVSRGLKKLRRQVRKRCKRMDHRGEEHFHDARKALKAYLGALGFLPEGTATPGPEMTGLPELLGDENDLATLSGWLKRHGFTADLAPGLWEKLDDTRHKLRKKAMRDAARIVPAGNA